MFWVCVSCFSLLFFFPLCHCLVVLPVVWCGSPEPRCLIVVSVFTTVCSVFRSVFPVSLPLMCLTSVPRAGQVFCGFLDLWKSSDLRTITWFFWTTSPPLGSLDYCFFISDCHLHRSPVHSHQFVNKTSLTIALARVSALGFKLLFPVCLNYDWTEQLMFQSCIWLVSCCNS